MRKYAAYYAAIYVNGNRAFRASHRRIAVAPFYHGMCFNFAEPQVALIAWPHKHLTFAVFKVNQPSSNSINYLVLWMNTNIS